MLRRERKGEQVKLLLGRKCAQKAVQVKRIRGDGTSNRAALGLFPAALVAGNALQLPVS